LNDVLRWVLGRLTTTMTMIAMEATMKPISTAATPHSEFRRLSWSVKRGRGRV